MVNILLAVFFVLFYTKTVVNSREIVFDGIPNDDSLEIQIINGKSLNSSLNALLPGDIFIIKNQTYFTQGGIIVTTELNDVIINIQGTLKFNNDRSTYPTNEIGVLECLHFQGFLNNVTFTSYLEDDNYPDLGDQSTRGTIDGGGRPWWGAIDYLKYQEDRPRLFVIDASKNIIFERILLLNSPFWSFWAQNSDNLIIRYSEVYIETKYQKHSLWDLQKFNTDGYDVTGRNIHIHDVNVYNNDDCICIKDDTQNVLVENVVTSGLGLVVGSIGSSHVSNITFKNAIMPYTIKGIYLKTRWRDEGPSANLRIGISDVLYENITIIKPQQFAIWLGPAQQAGQHCSLLWPIVDKAECRMSGYQHWNNIRLKDILVIDPKYSPGVFLGNDTNPIKNVFLENVFVQLSNDTIKEFKDIRDFKNTRDAKSGQDLGSELDPWGLEYYCDNIKNGISQDTSPPPSCFTEV